MQPASSAGRDLRDDLVQRVVPRRDRADDADRLADDEGVADLLRPREVRGQARDALATWPSASRAWTLRENVIGEPISAVIDRASSSWRFLMPSRMRSTSPARSSSGTRDHEPNACRAASTAASISARPPRGTSAIVSPVAGFTTGIEPSPPVARAPSIQWSVRVPMLALIPAILPDDEGRRLPVTRDGFFARYVIHRVTDSSSTTVRDRRMRTALTEMLGVEHPLVGFNRSPAVVAAVTNAGGFGVLAASMYSPTELDAQLTLDRVAGRRAPVRGRPPGPREVRGRATPTTSSRACAPRSPPSTSPSSTPCSTSTASPPAARPAGRRTRSTRSPPRSTRPARRRCST